MTMITIIVDEVHNIITTLTINHPHMIKIINCHLTSCVRFRSGEVETYAKFERDEAERLGMVETYVVQIRIASIYVFLNV